MILISPSGDRGRMLGPFSKYVALTPPFGIGLLAGYLQSQGKTVHIIDEEIEPVTTDLIREKLNGLEKPYIIGISCLTTGIARGLEIAKLIKQDPMLHNSVVIFGGIHPTVMPAEVLQSGNADIVVRNEGEVVLDQLYDLIKNGLSYSKIFGISFVEDGIVTHNPPADIVDLNNIPPFPYELFFQYYPKYALRFILSSRGCPYDCIFCSNRAVTGRYYRFRSPEIVLDEISYLHKKRGYNHIGFFDDNFLANKKRVVSLCELILSKFGSGIKFDCQARADSIDKDIVALLKKTGFQVVHIGIECANDSLLELVNKKETLIQIIDGVKMLRAGGLKVSGTFIFGLPSETSHDRQAAYQLANDLDLNYVRFNNATPYPGTKLYELAKAKGYFNPGKNWENLNAVGILTENPFRSNDISYVPDNTSAIDLKNDVIKYNLLFSLRPRRLYKILFDRTSPGAGFELPEKWYFQPGDIMGLLKLSTVVGINLLALFVRISWQKMRDAIPIVKSVINGEKKGH